jgi:hypothetical protein
MYILYTKSVTKESSASMWMTKDVNKCIYSSPIISQQHQSINQSIHVRIKLNPLTLKLNPSTQPACRDLLLGILIFEGLTARPISKLFGVKGLMHKLGSHLKKVLPFGAGAFFF